MPAPLVSPPLSDTGAISNPRTLNRWLDVHPVSKLDRVSSFITLPAFSQAVTWLGYSEIIASFNYEGPNNFNLKSMASLLPLNPNYCLCIMWKDSTNKVYRYSLWRGAGEVFYFPVIAYTGQLIKKNFRFEVWSTNSTPAVQATPLQFYTSVLGGQDYMWAGDFTLVSADAINTSFGDSAYATVDAPAAGLIARWRADTGVGLAGSNVTGWFDSISNYFLAVTGTPEQTSSAAINGQKFINLTNGSLANISDIISQALNPSSFVILIAGKSAVGDGASFFELLDNTVTDVRSLASNNDTSSFTFNGAISLDAAAGIDTFSIFALGTYTDATYTVPYYGLIQAFSDAPSGNTVVSLKLNQKPVNVAEILIYQGFASAADFAQFNVYIAQRYGSSKVYALPLTFPPVSQPQPN